MAPRCLAEVWRVPHGQRDIPAGCRALTLSLKQSPGRRARCLPGVRRQAVAGVPSARWATSLAQT